MATSQILQSRWARWALPVGTVAIIGGGLTLTSVAADAAAPLPEKSAQQLLADVASAPERPFSGTVVQTARLGLPELPGGAGSTSLQSLVSGSHTARVWYASEDRARFSLVGDLAQTDVVRRGQDVWLWSSTENSATRYRLPAQAEGRAKAGGTPSVAATPLPGDPTAAAEQILAAVDPTTRVEVVGTSTVAGRSAYELVLSPKDDRSLVNQVRLAVDGETSVPLRVQLLAEGQQEPAFETAFTAVQFEQPADSVFTFTPPPGAKVTEGNPAPGAGQKQDGDKQDGDRQDGDRGAADSAGAAGARVVGTGWTAVAVVPGVDDELLSQNATANALLRTTTEVKGSYGTGRLLRTPLVSALVLDDGTAYVGAVQPSVLEAAASAASRD